MWWINLLFGFLSFAICTGCTICFQNISTHGTATDLVDENQTTSPTTNTSVPLMPLKTPALK